MEIGGNCQYAGGPRGRGKIRDMILFSRKGFVSHGSFLGVLHNIFFLL